MWFQTYEKGLTKRLDQITNDLNNMKNTIQEAKEEAHQVMEIAKDSQAKIDEFDMELEGFKEDMARLYVIKEELRDTVKVMVAAEVQAAMNKTKFQKDV